MESDELSQRLAQIRSRRGYLLPHHGLMAVAAPNLLSGYDATYAALTLDERTLSRHNHECVWLAILIATDEALATHHIPKFRNAGGTDDTLRSILSLTAFTLGVGAYRFVHEHWRAHLPGLEPEQAYLDGFAHAAGNLPPRLAHLCGAAVLTCKAQWPALAWQICAAYAAEVPEMELAEALSLTMFPGSVPYFVEAARVWRELIVAGRVAASPGFAAWARMTGQGGYDEAAGTPPGAA